MGIFTFHYVVNMPSNIAEESRYHGSPISLRRPVRPILNSNAWIGVAKGFGCFMSVSISFMRGIHAPDGNAFAS